MTAFEYESCVDSIRDDLKSAYRAAWHHIASPGTWLTGPQRVAIAEETRRARSCALCREARQTLSPISVRGEHDHAGGLPARIVDQIHRVTTDPGRLSEKWLQSLLSDAFPVEHYVEALGVAVVTISIDRFHHALGIPEEPLPTPLLGEPSRVRPAEVEAGEAWVPMQSASAVGKQMGTPRAPYVLRALSLVPAEVEAWKAVSNAQYLSMPQMMSFDSPRVIDRSQIELVAGRVSALNECFY